MWGAQLLLAGDVLGQVGGTHGGRPASARTPQGLWVLLGAAGWLFRV